MPGAAGPGGLPPMPGAGGPGGLPPMPSAGAAGGNPLDTSFQVIMRVMPELDAYMEGLRTAGSEKVSTLQLTTDETKALQNEELHERFLRIQTRARQLAETAGGAADDALVKDAVKFASDLEAHVGQIKSVHSKLGLPVPAITGPRDVPKLQPRPDR